MLQHFLLFSESPSIPYRGGWKLLFALDTAITYDYRSNMAKSDAEEEAMRSKTECGIDTKRWETRALDLDKL